MRFIGNGRKQRVYLSASQRRALAHTIRSVRCPSCNNQRIRLEGSRSLMCWACGWWSALGAEVFVTFDAVPHQGCNKVTRVQEISIQDGQTLFRRSTLS